MKEHQNIEWKENWRDEYLKWICGFANAEGGVLVIGRSDRGDVVGLKDAARLLADLPNKVRDVLGILVDVNLREDAGRWSLHGRLARALAEDRNDDLAAILEEVATLHASLLHETPHRLRERRPFTLADQDGTLIARSSRVRWSGASRTGDCCAAWGPRSASCCCAARCYCYFGRRDQASRPGRLRKRGSRREEARGLACRTAPSDGVALPSFPAGC